ncbi:MAG: CPBP family intramembrane metalloprotease [Bacteroidales bacterium]|nr:CPBP family intramembrane metalloprotease [Bacteroidales bacterium]
MMKRSIRAIALSVLFSSIGFVLSFLLRKVFDIDLSKLEMSIIAFIITTLCALLLFPIVFKIPFGKVSIREFIYRVGLFPPKKIHGFILLGVLAAATTLSAMLIGSLLTGKYVFDSSKITLAQAIFSLTPGIWEEVFYRGIIMIVLLRISGSFKKAAIIQVVIFAIAHIKGFDLKSIIDLFSVLVIAIGFTFMAYKTKSLIPGIVFHYLHDTFLFSVQIPGGEYTGFKDNALFYSALWIAIGIVIILTHYLSKKYKIINKYNFYRL